MYYRTVNRGVVITGPGRWTIALIMILGMIAIVSGYNGVYLSLSVGSAILVVSGVLSERFMKSYFVESVTSVTADANAPFTLEAQVSNRDPGLVVYGMENLFYTKAPRWGVLREDTNFSARSLCLVLQPGQRTKISGQCQGLERGLYSNWRVVQRTLYPFGLVSKFKVSEVSADVMVLPPFEEEYANEVRKKIHSRFQSSDSESEFHSHRSYQFRDSARSVDWKRSAGKERKDWVVKNRQTQSTKTTVVLVVSPHWLGNPALREKRLGQVRTAVDVIGEMGREVALEWDSRLIGSGQEVLYHTLAAFPDGKTGTSEPLLGEVHRLVLDDNLRWESP